MSESNIANYTDNTPLYWYRKNPAEVKNVGTEAVTILFGFTIIISKCKQQRNIRNSDIWKQYKN